MSQFHASKPQGTLLGSSSGHWGERLIGALLLGCAAVSILTTLTIIGVLAYESALFFADVSPWRFVTDTEWTPLFADKQFGIWPLMAGTMLTTSIALLTAVPLGLLAAIYLAEYAQPRLRQTLKPVLELLAGVPTIVYGYFALVFVTPALQTVFGGLAGSNALSPGLVMGIMIMPMVSSLSEDALYNVPTSLREAAWGLGATKLRTIFSVILPTARSGIAASITLAMSRAIGETMIVTIAAGQQPRLTLDPTVPVQTMTSFIVQVSKGDTPAGTLEYKAIFVVGATLFAMTLVMNMLSQRLARSRRT